MPEVLGFETGVGVPSLVNSFGGGTLTIIVTIIIIALAIALGLFLYINNKTFNKKIILFENIAGQGYQVTYRDKARIVKVGDGGEELLYLRKKKVYRTAYGKKMGKNTYWFAVGQDGYWYNILLGDLDAKMGMLDIEPVDRDMRYMHVAIRKNIAERYKRVGFLERYGAIMFNGIFLIIMLFGLWFLIDQIGELITHSSAVLEAAKPVMEAASRALGQADSICAGGTGIIPK